LLDEVENVHTAYNLSYFCHLPTKGYEIVRNSTKF